MPPTPDNKTLLHSLTREDLESAIAKPMCEAAQKEGRCSIGLLFVDNSDLPDADIEQMVKKVEEWRGPNDEEATRRLIYGTGVHTGWTLAMIALSKLSNAA